MHATARERGSGSMKPTDAPPSTQSSSTRLGWQRCGVIPGYALWPRGGLCDTTVFYRVLAD